MSPLLLPAHLIEARWILEAAQDRVAAVGEEEALACGQLPHDVGREDLAGSRVVADAARELDSRAEEVLLLCATPRWIAMAHSSAREADWNDAMMPSPVCLISEPVWLTSAARTMLLCTRTSCCACSSPRRCVSPVELSMSVKRIVSGPEGVGVTLVPNGLSDCASPPLRDSSTCAVNRRTPAATFATKPTRTSE